MLACLAVLFRRLREYSTLANLLTLICIIPMGLLSFDIIADFLVRKPTSTSQKQIDFDPSYFPDVLICRNPSIDENVANAYGYEPIYYWQGRTGNWNDGRFSGWNGVNGTQNFTKVMDKILSVKTDTELISQIWHLSKGAWKGETPEIEFTELSSGYIKISSLEMSAFETKQS